MSPGTDPVLFFFSLPNAEFRKVSCLLTMNLHSLGWDPFFENHFQPHSANGLIPARVAVEHGSAYRLLAEDGPSTARCSGRFLHQLIDRSDRPTVGDWVAIARKPGASQDDIQAVLPRRTQFSRAAIGKEVARQVIAANIDTVFLVTGLDQNYRLRRIERYLAVAAESGADPVIILNKTDVCPDSDARLAEVEAIARGVPVIAVSAITGEAFAEISLFIRPGKTIALLGSSGVGKSTLVNRLLGEELQDTGEARENDGRGRHTTTTRNLIVLPTGGILIDTPGLREIGIWDVGPGLESTFDDIADLERRCRFTDCSHDNEPGCAIREALDNGTLDPDRYVSWLKLLKEQAFTARQQDEALKRRHAAQWKRIATANRQKTRFEQKQQDQQ